MLGNNWKPEDKIGDLHKGGTIECPHCFERINVDATRCKHCQGEITHKTGWERSKEQGVSTKNLLLGMVGVTVIFGLILSIWFSWTTSFAIAAITAIAGMVLPKAQKKGE